MYTSHGLWTTPRNTKWKTGHLKEEYLEVMALRKGRGGTGGSGQRGNLANHASVALLLYHFT